MQTVNMERGRLRVYLGAAPGVGKTFAMLQEGQRRAERGTDVVIGFVETHGRAKTAEAIADLEVVQCRSLFYRGLRVEEMDLAAVLARRPRVALVDELAHTIMSDATGGPEVAPKRWQQISALLDAGIDVITTVNIQHLESLNDVVASITGVRQSETVPDRIVRTADAVELVDMSPQALRRRMAHGNIYAADRIDTALAHYFREGNLAALRELALLWLADRVEESLDRYRDAHRIDSTWPTRERVVVGVSGDRESQTLMRRAARIATRTTGGEWLAAYVSLRDGLAGVPEDRLEQLRTAAEEMGGSFHAVVADDPADGLLEFARGVNASQILVGASRRGRISALLRPAIGETVIAHSGDIDVHVVSHDDARRAPLTRVNRTALGRGRRAAGYVLALGGAAFLSVALQLTPNLHGLATESLLLLALVVATALVGGLLPAMLAAVISSLVLNFLFMHPTGTLSIADPENALALIVFVLTGVAVATVVDIAAKRTQQAVRARAEANALAVLSHRVLHSGGDPAELLRQAGEVFAMSGAAIIHTDTDTDSDGDGDGDGDEETVTETWGDAPTSAAQADASAEIRPGRLTSVARRRRSAASRAVWTYAAARPG